MMKVAFDIRSLGYTEKRTGVEEYIYNLARTFPKIDKKTQFVFFYNHPQNLFYLKELGEPKNVTLVNLKKNNRLFNFSTKLLGKPKISDFLPFKPDVVLIPSYRLLALGKGIKRVIVFHDLSFEHFPRFFSLKIRLWHKYIDLKKQARKSSHLIAVSQSTKNDLVNLYNTVPKKISVVYHGVNLPEINDFELKKIKEKLPEKFIFTLSTLEPRKNLKTLIKAFKLLKKEVDLPHKLVVAGKKGWLRKKDLALLNHPGIIWLDHISPKEKTALYKLADIFVLPTYYEGFGLPVLEAMSLGTPVITTNLSSLPEVTKDSALLINPHNLEELKNALKSLLESKNLRSIFKQKGLKRSKEFNWEKCAKETLKVLKKIA
ncbi:glycosyltransferase family 1 protein [Patescibacteria group bacterium]|nr:MAG: glycosyltransferase family 1 protein [Patescibacteria group bacterium]